MQRAVRGAVRNKKHITLHQAGRETIREEGGRKPVRLPERKGGSWVAARSTGHYRRLWECFHGGFFLVLWILPGNKETGQGKQPR